MRKERKTVNTASEGQKNIEQGQIRKSEGCNNAIIISAKQTYIVNVDRKKRNMGCIQGEFEKERVEIPKSSF